MSMIKGLRAATSRSPTRKAVTVQTMAAAGQTVSGVSAPGEESRLLSAVDRCIEILSDSVAKLPSYVIQRSTRERVPHQILYLLNDRPNEAMTPFVRKKVLETSRLEGGNAYDWIVRDPHTAAPVELIPIPWQLVQPWRDMGGRVWYDVTHPVTGEAMTVTTTLAAERGRVPLQKRHPERPQGHRHPGPGRRGDLHRPGGSAV